MRWPSIWLHQKPTTGGTGNGPFVPDVSLAGSHTKAEYLTVPSSQLEIGHDAETAAGRNVNVPRNSSSVKSSNGRRVRRPRESLRIIYKRLLEMIIRCAAPELSADLDADADMSNQTAAGAAATHALGQNRTRRRTSQKSATRTMMELPSAAPTRHRLERPRTEAHLAPAIPARSYAGTHVLLSLHEDYLILATRQRGAHRKARRSTPGRGAARCAPDAVMMQRLSELRIDPRTQPTPSIQPLLACATPTTSRRRAGSCRCWGCHCAGRRRAHARSRRAGSHSGAP